MGLGKGNEAKIEVIMFLGTIYGLPQGSIPAFLANQIW